MNPLYYLKGVTHRYGPRLSSLTLSIDDLNLRQGEVTELRGPNGSGKSTLLKILAFLEPFGGEMFFDGVLVGSAGAAGEKHANAKRFRLEATLLLQTPYLLRRSVYENIAYGLKLRKLPSGEIRARAEDSLLRVGLDPERFAPRPWYCLSGGEAQRVALAARLALRPRALLLDEPTASVDEASAAMIREAVFRSARDDGAAVITATHDADWMRQAPSDVPIRTVTLREGRVV